MKNLFLCVLCVFASHCFAQTSKGNYSFNVDNFPDIYGGKQEMKRFLHDHLIYPAEDFKNKKEGTVTLDFIVTKEGKTESIKVSKLVSPDMDKEAVRLLKLIDWIPSRKEGTAVNVNYNMDITFSLSKYKKQVKERGFDVPLYKDIPTDTSFSIYETAERSPVFNAPDKTFSEFVYANLEYPEAALKQSIEGNVKLSFVVEPDGQVSNIKILNEGVAGGCNNEAIRVIGLTKWEPAKRDKQYVRYRMSFTMNFSVKNSFKDNSNGSQRSWGQ
ncbi:MAG TPA: energy transducer TonB [Bacteroidia bacterium]